jgi:Leucine-rich repeat (LRR) protein
LRGISFENSTTIFDSLPNLLSLEIVSCSNQTSSINSNLLDNLPKLEQLTLKNVTPISDFKITPTVKHLYLTCNNFTATNQLTFENLSNLVSLRMNSNNFEDSNMNYENLFGGMKNLRKLEMAHSYHIPWRCWTHLSNLTEFVCKFCFGEVDFGVFKDLVNLKKLHLTDCDLEELPANVFVNQKKLEMLILFNNKLDDLNCETFNGLESLKVLNLEENPLRNFNLVKLNEILTKLKCLEGFYFSESEIDDYDEILDKLDELKIKRFYYENDDQV